MPTLRLVDHLHHKLRILHSLRFDFFDDLLTLDQPPHSFAYFTLILCTTKSHSWLFSQLSSHCVQQNLFMDPFRIVEGKRWGDSPRFSYFAINSAKRTEEYMSKQYIKSLWYQQWSAGWMVDGGHGERFPHKSTWNDWWPKLKREMEEVMCRSKERIIRRYVPQLSLLFDSWLKMEDRVCVRVQLNR